MAGLAFLKGNGAVGGFEGCSLSSSPENGVWGIWKKIDGKSCGGYHVPLSLFWGEM
ncbi:MAG: hypothetical protein HZA03_01790 [Nitrospinae bacterium]|nr:hypothetical protein [Nitrospinota bacterium]